MQKVTVRGIPVYLWKDTQETDKTQVVLGGGDLKNQKTR